MTSLDSINRKLVVPGDLNRMLKFLDDLDGNTLVHNVVLDKENGISGITRCDLGLRRESLEALCESLGEIVERGWGGDVARNEVLGTPGDCRTLGMTGSKVRPGYAADDPARVAFQSTPQNRQPSIWYQPTK
ncbi:hypothetical protein FRC12_021015 [Ceratobasidium sp. 428]|nr:hypothetical protein FRC12_021015 [Ceratobasidium sp. 428]